MWLANLFFRKPLREISLFAQELLQGRYGARLKPAAGGRYGELAETLNLLAEKTGAAMAQLRQDKAEIALILASMVEAVIAVDTQKRVLAVNPAFSELFGVPLEGARDKSFYEILRQAQLAGFLDRALGDGKNFSEEIRLFVPEEKIFEANALPLIREGRARGALLVLYDITRIRKLEQMRREFVANVSHELRTPLASIRGAAETLLAGALKEPQEAREFVQAVAEDAQRLNKLVDDLLDLSAIESGKGLAAFEPVDLLNTADDLALKFKGFAAKKGVTIKVEAFEGLPAVVADKEQMRRVFANLLDNAIKFNREGGQVTVRAETRERLVKILIEDTGAGIAPRHLARVFERFYRVDKARSREMGGTGLGLSIVKHIIEAHGGSLGVESVEGQGSVFYFSLPIKS